jgi:ketosteroid isomerase-like protein
MSQENVEATRARFEQFSRGDFSTAFEGMDDDFVFVTAAEMPDAGTYRGQQARDWILAYVASFDDYTQEATEILDAGDSVVVAVLQRGCPRGSDVSVESRWWQVLTFRNDSVTRTQMFSGRAQALKAAGLRE